MYPESADIGYKMGSHSSSEENIFVPIRAAFDLGNNWWNATVYLMSWNLWKKSFTYFLGKYLRCDMDKGDK